MIAIVFLEINFKMKMVKMSIAKTIKSKKRAVGKAGAQAMHKMITSKASLLL